MDLINKIRMNQNKVELEDKMYDLNIDQLKENIQLLSDRGESIIFDLEKREKEHLQKIETSYDEWELRYNQVMQQKEESIFKTKNYFIQQREMIRNEYGKKIEEIKKLIEKLEVAIPKKKVEGEQKDERNNCPEIPEIPNSEIFEITDPDNPI